jgi:hypothetical protein
LGISTLMTSVQPRILLGHVSVATTERYMGCKQRLREGAERQYQTGLQQRSLSGIPFLREYRKPRCCLPGNSRTYIVEARFILARQWTNIGLRAPPLRAKAKATSEARLQYKPSIWVGTPGSTNPMRREALEFRCCGSPK